MNNKSTENLLETEDIESLDIQSLDVENSNASHSKKFIAEIQSDVHKKAKKNFMVEKSDSTELKSLDRPIPAARKLTLAPIASKRNSKELKDDCNQMVWKQSLPSDDTIHTINEKNTENKHNSNTVESNSEKRPKSGKQSNIELAPLGKEVKKSKKHFVTNQTNEETTSFISYEEKHEKEDNSEHNQSSYRSSRIGKNSLDDKNGGRRNEAFVDSDENISTPKPNPIHEEDDEVSRTKSSKTKSKRKKIKSKKHKRSRHSTGEEITKDSSGVQNIQEAYDFKKLIGVWIHQSSALRFDPLIRQPRVRVSFYDLNDGELLNKSNPLRNAVSNYEQNVTFIQPILSDRCKFKVSSEIECDWCDEVLLINEDIRHIQRDHIIIFFEIVDILVSNGWYPICWAFLRPGNDKTFSNLNVRCELQLYYYQRTKNNILNEWKSQKKIKYPANLSVTVASYQHKSTQSVSLTRPMSVLEEERTEDIYTCATDDEKLSEQSDREEKSLPSERAQNSTRNSNQIESKVLNLKSRLPGQQCKCPNRLVYKHDISNHSRGHKNHTQYGAMVVKFSPNGSQIAFHQTTYTRSNHEIIVMKENNLQVSHVLSGHLSLIYDIDWLNERILISVASDRTAIVWFLSDGDFKIKVLPHPSFVYVSKWLSKSDADYAYAITGGRDCILRVWKISTNIDTDIELYDELIQHDNYITSLDISRKSTHLYSADWNGVLLEWIRIKNHKENDNGPTYQMSRKIKIFPNGIVRIELHTKSNRLYVQCVNDPLIYVIETTSAIVVKTMKFLNDDPIKADTRSTFTISPCGSLIFTKSPHENQIKCIRISNEMHAEQFRLPISIITKTYAVTSLSYHPTKDLIACAIFGDLIQSCMFLFCNSVDDANNIGTPSIQTENNAHDYDPMMNLQEYYNVQSHDTINTDGIKSILNRIDDLFFMAVRSSIVENDQFKDMELLLQKLSLESKSMPPNVMQRQGASQSTRTEEEHSMFYDTSNESNGPEYCNQTSRQLQSIGNSAKSNDSQSSNSKHTFQIFKSEKSTQQYKRTNDAHSDLSEPSNLTFEIKKTKHPEKNADANVK